MGEASSSARTAWVIWYCISLHLWWGLMLMVDPAAQGVTAINEMIRLTGSARGGAMVFLVVGALAAVGLLRARPGQTRGLLVVLPQQAVLLLSAFGAVEAVWCSQYADGVLRPRSFIAADQIPSVFIAVAHSAALIDCFIHGAGPGRTNR